MSIVTLPPLSAKASCFTKLERHLLISILISEKNPKSLEFFGSLTTIKRLRRRQIESRSYIIHPFSIFRLYYEMFMAIIFACCMIHHPLYSGFPKYKGPLGLDSLLDLFCLCDVIVTFRTGYVDVEDQKVIMNTWAIAKHYVTSVYFPADFLSSIPEQLFMKHDQYGLINTISAQLGFLKLFRLPRTYRYIIRTARFFKIDIPAFRIGLKLIFLLLILHWTTCFVILIPTFFDPDMPDYYGNDSWIIKNGIIHQSVFIQYTRSIYRASGFILAIKFGMVNEMSWEEKIFAGFCYIGGKILMCYVTVFLSVALHNKWCLKTDYICQLEELEGFMSRQKLSLALKKRIVTYYDYKFRNSYFEEDKLNEVFSERLRKEINIHISREFVSNVDILSNLTEELLKRVFSNLQTELYLPRDVIIKAGTPGDCMYFLYSGTVAVYTPSGREICHLQDGAYFGEICLLYKEAKRNAHVIALEISEVYKLSRHGFNLSFRREEAVMKILLKEARERKEITKICEDLCMRSHRYFSL